MSNHSEVCAAEDVKTRHQPTKIDFLDNSGLVGLQRQVMREQDASTTIVDQLLVGKGTMAEEEPKPLHYIPEIILKKRKSSEALALRKKDQLQQKKFQTKNSKDYIKKPDDFIIEY
ncbi:hypothetical protein K1719_043576 [Acacia pycnantha]|nr:hypothetical protein K1719_043576 [Acacia pycnantha]